MLGLEFSCVTMSHLATTVEVEEVNHSTALGWPANEGFREIQPVIVFTAQLSVQYMLI